MYIDKVKTYTVGEYSFVNFLQLDDETIENIRIWRNHPNIRKVMYNTDEITHEQHSKFISSLSESTSKYYWLVYKTDKPHGVVSIVDFHPEESTAQGGYYLIPDLLESEDFDFIPTIHYFLFNSIGVSKIYGYTQVINRKALGFNYLIGAKFDDNLEKINGIKYVKQEIRKEDFNDRFIKIKSSNNILSYIKEFNKIYKDLVNK